MPKIERANTAEPDDANQTDVEHDESGRLRRLANSALAAGKQAAHATVSGSRRAAEATGSTAAASARAVGEGAKSAVTTGASVARAPSSDTAEAGAAAGRAVGRGAQWVFDTARAATAQAFSSAQAIVASDLSSAVNDIVAGAVKGAPTIYDRAMDAKFIETGVGGKYHRLFDGGHTVFGAFEASHNASPDDTLVQETLGAIQGLLRDVSTPMGLPLATWDKETFDAVAASLDTNFGIPKKWLYDLNTFDAADLLGGAVGAVSVIFSWNRADTETFSQTAASMALSTALSTNPVLMPIAVVALGRAFHKARSAGEYGDLVDGAFRGAVTSGASLGAIALVGVAGGPAGVAMLTGIMAGALVSKLTREMELTADLDVVRQAICRFVKDEARSVMGQIAAQAVSVGDNAANLAAIAGSAATRAATAAAGAVGEHASQTGRAVASGAASAGSATAGAAAAAGRATADAAQAAGRAGAAAAAAARSAGESAARRTKALVERDGSEDPATDEPRPANDSRRGTAALPDSP